MTNEMFTARFEDFVPRALQTAFNYVDGCDAVETIWIVGHRDGDWATGGAVYRLHGLVVRPFDVVKADPSLDNSVENQMSLQPIGREAGDLLLMDRDNSPTRFVVRYDVVAQAMNADFSYEPLTMGPDDTLGEVAAAWFERLRSTGDDSASD